MGAGYVEEATAWRDWVVRAVAGDPEDIQIMYGLGGERRLDEYELPHLKGYEGSAPVRIGNAASGQLQLDVYGEVIDAIYVAQRLGMPPTHHGEELGRRLLAWLEKHWQEPDDGVWEVRGGRKQFVHSKVMVWVAVDRLEKMAETYGLVDILDRLRTLRDAIHEEICREGYDAERNTFTQYYGSKQLDASLLLIPMMGFLPADDPRSIGTVEAVERELMKDGFVMRYIPDAGAADGLPPGEGAFLACSFWLVNDLARMGRRKEAEALFDRLLALRNDLGLFSEEYDQANKQLIGNMPQAFTHLTLIRSAIELSANQGRVTRLGNVATIAPPSGDQFELSLGDQHVVVTEVGATLRSYTADGAAVLDGFARDEASSSGRGQILSPWPNRLEDGRYTFEGITGTAALDEPEARQRDPRTRPVGALATRHAVGSRRAPCHGAPSATGIPVAARARGPVRAHTHRSRR